jgi:opacity protein-like surface antigen
LWTKDDAFAAQDRTIHTVFIRPSVDISPNVTVGLNGSVSWIDYSEDVQADGKTVLVGPYVQVKISEATEFYAEVGWQKSDFDGGTQQVITQEIGGVQVPTFSVDTQDSDSIYYKVQITNRPTDGFRHSLLASRTTETGLGSNYYELYHFEYSADWVIQERTSISPTAFYEYYETSGAGSEEASRLGLALGIHHQLSESITIGLDYRFLMKDSNLPRADYKQNLGMLSVYYKF